MEGARSFQSRALESTNWRDRAAPGAPSEKLEDEQSQQRVPGARNGRAQRDNLRPRNIGPNEQGEKALEEGRRIYVGNLLYTVKALDVEQLFRKEGYDIDRVHMSVDSFSGRNPSYCFVELRTKQCADRALESLNGVEFFNRPLKVKPCVPRKDSHPRPFDTWSRSDAPKYYEGYVERGRRLYVGGLPKPENRISSDAMITEFFKGYNVGAVSKVISPHESTKGKPGNHFYAFVDLATPEEACAAARALNGLPAFGGKLRVNMAKRGSRKAYEREQCLEKPNFRQEEDVGTPSQEP